MSILIIEHSNLTGSDRLGERLLQDGHKLHTVRVHIGEQLPFDLEEIDGVVSCGGPQAPDCHEEWIEQELALLREADQLQIPPSWNLPRVSIARKSPWGRNSPK